MILLRFSTFVWTVVCGSTSYGFDVCSGCYFAAVLTLVLTVFFAAVWRSLDSGFAAVFGVHFGSGFTAVLALVGQRFRCGVGCGFPAILPLVSVVDFLCFQQSFRLLICYMSSVLDSAAILLWF